MPDNTETPEINGFDLDSATVDQILDRRTQLAGEAADLDVSTLAGRTRHNAIAGEIAGLDSALAVLNETPATIGDAPAPAETPAADVDVVDTDPELVVSAGVAGSVTDTTPAAPAAPVRPRWVAAASVDTADGFRVTAGANVDQVGLAGLVRSTMQSLGAVVSGARDSRVIAARALGHRYGVLSDSQGDNDRVISEAQAAHVDELSGTISDRIAASCCWTEQTSDIKSCGAPTTPFADLFPALTGVNEACTYRFTPGVNVVSAQVAAGNLSDQVVTWTAAQQALVDPNDPATWKPCATVTCPTVCEVSLTDPLVLCLDTEVLTRFSRPQHEAALVSAAELVWAQRLEQAYMALFDRWATEYLTFGTKVLGATNNAAVAVAQTIAKWERAFGMVGQGNWVAVADDEFWRVLGYDVSRRGSNGRRDVVQAGDSFRVDAMHEFTAISGAAPVATHTAGVGDPDPIQAVTAVNQCIQAAAPAVSTAELSTCGTFRIRLFDVSGFARFEGPNEFLRGGDIPVSSAELRQNRRPTLFFEQYPWLLFNGCLPPVILDVAVSGDGTLTASKLSLEANDVTACTA